MVGLFLSIHGCYLLLASPQDTCFMVADESGMARDRVLFPVPQR